MDLNIVMLDGTSHRLLVNPQDTVGSLKTLVHQKLGVSPQMQKLVFDNGQRTHLSDDSTPLTYYGLQPGSHVSLLVRQPETIQVFLRNEKGQTSTYDIKPDESVNNFRAMVQQREGVPASQQRLIHESKEMSDGRRLSDYDVRALSTIHMVLRLRGG